jgi:membrane complex biogenesis BtpA family protein
MSWFSEAFGKEKIIVASLYLPPLPGNPDYFPGTSLKEIIEFTRHELQELEAGGMDSVCIGNQQNWPYQVKVNAETPALMTMVINEASRGLKIPLGITVFWDDLAAIAVAKAVGAVYVRGVFRGAYAGEMGLISLNASDAVRYRKLIDAEKVRLMFMLRPILAKSIADRGLEAEVKDAVWGSKPDAFALCGPIPGEAPTLEELAVVQKNAKGRPVVMNNGATPQNIAEVLKTCDGAMVATHLRKDEKAGNPFDAEKVRTFMKLVNQNR